MRPPPGGAGSVLPLARKPETTIGQDREISTTKKSGRFPGDEQGHLLPGLCWDGLHLTRAGYEAWADVLVPELGAALTP